ncbi:MAG: hypothetical protein IKP68_08045 [Clostridia bacterium]|nr:hypothetical protein [Clostridia bacterium]
MAFDEGTTTVMPVAPTGYGFGGNGMGWGGDATWLIILFLFAAMGGWGNGFGGNGGNGGFYPWVLANNTDNLVTSGFNNAATAGTLAGIQSSITNGFGTAEIAACNRAMDAMQTAYNNQIASMNQSFANSQALDARLDALAMSLQNCCCENRASIADVKYTIATEACADRAAVNDALRDVLTANTASTQRILDQMCQDKIDAKNEKIADLERQLTMANFAASQGAQTAAILADNSRQTATLEDYLNPVARPAYVVANPNCCQQNFGCGCNCNG